MGKRKSPIRDGCDDLCQIIPTTHILEMKEYNFVWFKLATVMAEIERQIQDQADDEAADSHQAGHAMPSC